jgi:restriction endonuclease S subunit
MQIISGGGGYDLGDTHLFSVFIGRRVVETQLLPNGEVPVYSANVFEPFGYINERLLTDFSVPSVLWGIDGDWMVHYIPENSEFYPTDHCGVLRVNTDAVHPRCLAWALEEEGKRRGFSRTLRASIDRVKRLTIQLPPIDEQRKTAEQVFEYEAKIIAAKTKLSELEGKKQDILTACLGIVTD